jgi:TolB-like protein/thioredoxin-like negative regulator of GroEL
VSFFAELQRRNVIRAAIFYLASAWLVTQVAETVFPLYGFGDAPARVVVTLLAIGFPVFLVVSWVFEFTPEGFKRERDMARGQSDDAQSGRTFDRLIMVVLALALGYFAFDKFLLDPERDARRVTEAAQEARSQALTESFGDQSVAVLPFVNMSPDPEQEYFSHGIAEELLHLLARIPDLRVISRSSAFRFKGADLDVPAIARQLNVAHVVEGSVRKAGDQIRITAQLIDARSDTHLWSATYDRELTAQNVFDIQHEIAANISMALNMVLSDADRERLSRGNTDNLAAYEAYLLGRQRATARTHEALLEAADYFEKALALDPQFALAHVGLADTYLLLANYGFLSAGEALAEVDSALAAALWLDDQLGAAYASLGLSRSSRGDLAGAAQAFREAIALDPNYATSYHWYADVLLNAMGQPDAAIPLLKKARQLDPLSPVVIVTLGEALAALGQVTEAMALFARALEVQGDFPSGYFLIGTTYLDLGAPEEAAAWIEHAHARWPDNITTIMAQVMLRRDRREVGQGMAYARQLNALAPGNNLALVAMVDFGRHEEALEAFVPSYPELSCEGEPEVGRRNLAQAINLSLAWERTGEVECAGQLLAGVVRTLQAMPADQSRSFGFLEVEAYARQGRVREALDALRAALDEGWRRGWRTQVENSPHMVFLKGLPEFEAMVTEVRAEMAVELQGVRRLQDRGEFPAGPQ